MDGFKRSPRRPVPSQPPVQSAPGVSRDVPTVAPMTPTPLPQQDIGVLPTVQPLDPQQSLKSSKNPKKKLFFVVGGIVLLLIATALAIFGWYSLSIQPVNSKDKQVIRLEVKEKSSLSAIADQLEERKLIKSSYAFMIYARLHSLQDGLKAGTCNLSPSESVGQILDKLTAGCHDFRSVTFYPGATINSSMYAKDKAQAANQEYRDFSIRHSLSVAGFSESDIDAALSARYEGPLFADKPATAGLEGYIFGETYYAATGASAKDVLQLAFDHMYEIVKQEDLVTKFKAQGLNLHQGITLASIVERELDCEGKPTQERKDRCYGYQQTIAQIFLTRFQEGGLLGSDVTFIYAADKMGVAAAIDLDSPYNTRRYAGLPPGPVSSPGQLALKAVANPSDTNYYYFIAGDDGLIYFARTLDEHESNIVNHCAILCSEV